MARPELPGDHHDAVAHALIVARDRARGVGQVGVADRRADRLLRRPRLISSTRSIRQAARHLHDGVDEMRRPDHAPAQRPTSTTPGTARMDVGGLFGDAGGGLVEQGLDGGRSEPQAKDRDHHGNADRSRGVAPGIAEPGQRQPEDDGDRTQHVGSEMQRVGGQRLGKGCRAPRVQRARRQKLKRRSR